MTSIYTWWTITRQSFTMAISRDSLMLHVIQITPLVVNKLMYTIGGAVVLLSSLIVPGRAWNKMYSTRGKGRGEVQDRT